MKKLSIVVAVTCFLMACGNTDENNKQPTETTNKQTEQNGTETTPELPVNSITTVNGEQVVQRTISTNEFDQLADEEITEILQQQGAQQIVFNENKTISYTIPKQQFDTEKQTLEKQLDQLMSEVNAAANFPTIQEVTADKSYTKYRIVVDRNAYEESYDSTAIISLMISATYYLSYIGDTSAFITVDYIDGQTNQSYKTETYPEQ